MNRTQLLRRLAGLTWAELLDLYLADRVSMSDIADALHLAALLRNGGRHPYEHLDVNRHPGSGVTR